VRWIGPAGSDNPAPTVSVTAAADEHAAAPAAAAPTPAASQRSDSSGSDTLAIIALIVGALGLAAGAAALIASRRTRTPAGV
jgi:uncharacterized protein HemX